MSYELFVEVTRNGTVESRHFGAAIVCDAKGDVVESWGNIENLIFPRSALKPMLAIQLVESGASTRYALNDAELSLACSSHQGEQMHQDLVVSWLNRLGLTEDHLACGPVLPEHTESAHQLLASGQKGCRIHHNCSGKHTGFLTTALHLDIPLDDYHQIEHPLQQLSLDILSDLADVDLKQYPINIQLGSMVVDYLHPRCPCGSSVTPWPASQTLWICQIIARRLSTVFMRPLPMSRSILQVMVL
jgi:L-asparaginase II